MDRQDYIEIVGDFLTQFYKYSWDAQDFISEVGVFLAENPAEKKALLEAYDYLLNNNLSSDELRFLVEQKSDRPFKSAEKAQELLREIYETAVLQKEPPPPVLAEAEDETPAPLVTEDDWATVLADLNSLDADARSAAAYRLGYSDAERAIAPLQKTLADREAKVRLTAAQALGRLNKPAAIEPLLAIISLEEEDSLVRSMAMLALADMKAAEATPGLLRLLQHANPRIRTTAQAALGQLGAVTVKPLLEALQNEALTDEEVQFALGLIQDRAAVPILIETLQAEKAQLRAIAATSLYHFNDSQAVEPLRQVLTDPDPNVRHAANGALNQLLYNLQNS